MKAPALEPACFPMKSLRSQLHYPQSANIQASARAKALLTSSPVHYPPPCCSPCVAMSQCQHTPSVTFLLLLLCVTPQITIASPLVNEKQTSGSSNATPPTGAPQLSEVQWKEEPVVEQGEVGLPQTPSEEEDELFKDVDPKTLAAVLLEALNHQEDAKKSSREGENEEVVKGEEEREIQGADRDRDGRQELELVMAAAATQDKENQEREKEQKEEEEERLTEKVKSRTTSQTMPVQSHPEQEVLKEEKQKEEEEQLSPDEVKNLQTMLEELQRYSTATKREWDSTGQRESRGSYIGMDQDFLNNEIIPKPKGYKLALSKKKLKWQEEQQKKKQPLFRGGNFMDDFDINSQEDDDDDDDDKYQEEEILSPEEEEARAKAEQEEVRRQAAEAQRAKAEEEKLADIASDMLLQYMIKPDGKQNQDQSKKVSLGNNVEEDKRSDEENDTNDEDDIDPQTIDKLIEISSKLHLPADDVVDIISDVEKKKRKETPENLPWHRPLAPPPLPAPAPLNSQPKQPNQFTRPSKTWFQDKIPIKQNKQELWAKPQKQFWTYPTYSFYQKPYHSYYPIYFPPPKPKPRYYAKPALSFSDLLGNSMNYEFDFSPKRRLRPWNQPAFRRNLYIPNYIVPNPRTFRPVPMPKPRSPPRRRPSFYYPQAASVMPRDEDYFEPMGQQSNTDQDLENFIEKVFMKRPRLFQ
ncbi:neurosecretory protein VGF-like [Arapaima gigas]